MTEDKQEETGPPVVSVKMTPAEQRAFDMLNTVAAKLERDASEAAESRLAFIELLACKHNATYDAETGKFLAVTQEAPKPKRTSRAKAKPETLPTP